MYIAPNSTIKILKNCPLDTTYDHTLYFANTASQYAYFNGLTKYQFSQQSYQRVQKGRMRIERKADDLYDCNYLMFQNTAYGTKWFYAFIKSVEYVNNVTSEIEFQIDVMQTWLAGIDYELADSYIVREHTTTDEIGDNLVPENLETGEMIENVRDEMTPTITELDRVVFINTFKTNQQTLEPYGSDYDESGSFINGVFNCCEYLVIYGVSNIRLFLNNVVSAGKIDGILGAYTVPKEFDTINFERTTSVPKRSTHLNYYYPRNKKLFTYPYNYLRIHTDVADREFRYEFFSGTSCQFKLYNSLVPAPSMSLIPYNYLSQLSANQNDYRMALTDYPQCAIGSDVYKVYLAQNASSLSVKQLSIGVKGITGIAAAGLSGIVAASTFDVGGALSSMSNMVTSMVNQQLETEKYNAMLADIERKPPQVTGTQTTLMDYSSGCKKIIASQMTVRAEFARIIDEYFDLFGYACHRVKKPNIHVRKHWTYTKTLGCDIHGSVPCDDMATICSIYDKGITFWNNGNEVGEYVTYRDDNTPL